MQLLTHRRLLNRISFRSRNEIVNLIVFFIVLVMCWISSSTIYEMEWHKIQKMCFCVIFSSYHHILLQIKPFHYSCLQSSSEYVFRYNVRYRSMYTATHISYHFLLLIFLRESLSISLFFRGSVQTCPFADAAAALPHMRFVLFVLCLCLFFAPQTWKVNWPQPSPPAILPSASFRERVLPCAKIVQTN